ncbi:carbohydrate kinase [Desulforhopalus sp. IMCC35007]|uniref:carbohydrate kinase family protein n=1 Tax=Desulforhopalus sp. IMCC35007 TaxID=2569543 RepID=UPI00197AA74C|nr:carbohydrate kinase [Desulforhopalus sp. IMCC35007]
MQANKMKTPVIAGIGEILWDVIDSSEELGGAPVNFAYHTGALGAESYAISTVGDDNRGRAALSTLERQQMSTDHITVIGGATTGYVLAEVDDQGVASYTFPDDVAWDRLSIRQCTKELAARLDAVCFGSLVQRSDISRKAVMDYLSLVREDTLKVFDVNLRQHFYTEAIIRSSLEVADVVKLNDEEIVHIARMENLKGTAEAQLKALVERYELELAVLTCGGEGSLLVSASEISKHTGRQTDIVDTIGAGDSFTATVILGLLKGYTLDTINDNANQVAAFVCSQKGAMPHLPERFRIF